MEYLNWELSVLSRAVAYRNLSAAADNVGISQPQLSRIIARIEHEMAIPILDRTSKRSSGWTAQAYRLAEIYSQTFRRFSGEVQNLASESQLSHVRIAALEGLIPMAEFLGVHLFRQTSVTVIELDVQDLDSLEEQFFRDRYQLVLTSREPGRKKYERRRLLGYQNLVRQGDRDDLLILSSFEYGVQYAGGKGLPARDSGTRILVSNSLAMRRKWLERTRAKGQLPSPVRPLPPEKRRAPRSRLADPSQVPVLLIGSSELPQEFWQTASSFPLEDPLIENT